MKSIEQKMIELKNRMDNCDTYQKDDGVMSALQSLENEINKYSEIEIYKEDFSDISWSYVTQNNNLKSVIAYAID